MNQRLFEVDNFIDKKNNNKNSLQNKRKVEKIKIKVKNT